MSMQGTRNNRSWLGRRASRRTVLRGAGILGVGAVSAALVGCGDEDEAVSTPGSGAGTEVSGTPGSGAGTEVSGSADLGIVRVGIANDAQSGDSAITGGGSWPVTAYVYNSLVAQDKRDDAPFPFAPALATSWEASDGIGAEWVFHLREGVRFHDGTVLTADDVVFSFERMVDPDVKSTQAGFIERLVNRVEAIDDQTVRFSLNEPDVTWPHQGGVILIVPRAYTERVGLEEFAAKPVGTGPFVLQERLVNQRIKYARFEDYWNTGIETGIPGVPAVSGAELRVLPEDETRISALLAGELDIIVNVPSTAIARLKGESGVSVQSASTGQPLGILINSQWETAPDGSPNPYRDIRVRKALNLAVNLDEIIERVLTGDEKPNTGVNERAIGALQLEPYPYDPAEATRLLDAAGYGAGLKGEHGHIFNPGNRWSQSRDVCEAIGGYLRAVGIEGSVRDLEYATAAAELNKKTLYPMAFWGQGSSAETITQADLVFTTPGIRGLYQSSSEMEALIAKARSTLDVDERGQVYGEMQTLFFNDAAHIFLYSALYSYATRDPWTWDAGVPRSGEVALWDVRQG